jgi:hypothetical protein
MKLNYKNNSSDGLRSLVPFLTLGVIGVVFLSVIPTGVHAQEFIPLVGIPYVDTQSSDLSLAGYVNALYTAAISIAAFMAVVKIIFAGVKYMLSDVVTDKGAAKKDIRGALIGLLIVIGAVLILNTINPQLKGLGALEGPGGVRIELTEHGRIPLDETHVVNVTGSRSETEAILNYIAECNDMGRSIVIRNGISCAQITAESVTTTPADTTLPINDQVDTFTVEQESQGLEDLLAGITVDVVMSDEAEIEQVRSRCEGSGGSKMVLLTHTVDGVEYGRLMCFG